MDGLELAPDALMGFPFARARSWIRSARLRLWSCTRGPFAVGGAEDRRFELPSRKAHVDTSRSRAVRGPRADNAEAKRRRGSIFRFAEGCGLIGSGAIDLCGSRCTGSRYIDRVLRALRDDERTWANAVYRSIKFAETPAGTYALAYELDGEIVGLGRLVELEPDVIELGGIWTAEAARGRGIARAIVMALIEHAGDSRLWCIPFLHLQRFYESCGFVVQAEPWPAMVTAKMRDCIAKQLPPAIVLVRG